MIRETVVVGAGRAEQIAESAQFRKETAKMLVGTVKLWQAWENQRLSPKGCVHFERLVKDLHKRLDKNPELVHEIEKAMKAKGYEGIIPVMQKEYTKKKGKKEKERKYAIYSSTGLDTFIYPMRIQNEQNKFASTLMTLRVMDNALRNPESAATEVKFEDFVERLKEAKRELSELNSMYARYKAAYGQLDRVAARRPELRTWYLKEGRASIRKEITGIERERNRYVFGYNLVIAALENDYVRERYAEIMRRVRSSGRKSKEILQGIIHDIDAQISRAEELPKGRITPALLAHEGLILARNTLKEALLSGATV